MELLLLALVAAGIFAASSDSASSTTPGTTPPSTAPPINCDAALKGLPDTFKAMLDVASKNANPVAAMGTVADVIDEAGYHDAAFCVRAVVKTMAGPPGSGPGACDAALNDVPDSPPIPPGGVGMRTTVKRALVTGSKPALLAVADQLDTMGFHDAATCVRGVAATKETPVPGGGVPGGCDFLDVPDVPGPIPPPLAAISPPGMATPRGAARAAFATVRSKAEAEGLAIALDSMGASTSATCVRNAKSALPDLPPLLSGAFGALHAG